MSNDRNNNDKELWDVLDDPVPTDPKKSKNTSRPKIGPRFAKPGPIPESPDGPPIPARRFDGFFFGCMAGVAALSVAATLLIGGISGGREPTPPAADPVITTTAPIMESSPDALSALKQENDALRQQVELQRQQIQDLRAELLDLTGSAGTTDPAGDEQIEAYAIFQQIQAAYDDFDREKLEELIPEMDKRLEYLSSDALNEYYQILEYVEQPSNG